MKSGLTIFSMLALLAPISAAAKITCTASNACSIADGSMPIFSQHSDALKFDYDWSRNGGGTALCGPSSATMVLKSIGRGVQVNSGTDLSRIMNSDNFAAVDFVADVLMNSINGTTGSQTLDYVRSRLEAGSPMAVSYVAMKSASSTWNAGPSGLLNQFKAGRIPISLLGYYTPSCSNLADGTRSCTYKRGGGHIYTYKGVAGNKVFMNDSGYGRVHEIDLKLLPTKSSSGQVVKHYFGNGLTQATAWDITLASWREIRSSLWIIEAMGSVGGSANLASSVSQPTPTPMPTPLATPKPTPIPTPTPAPTLVEPKIVKLILYNATTDRPIRELTNGMVIDRAVYGSKLTIVAEVSGAPARVRFESSNGWMRDDLQAPFSLYGENGPGDFIAWTPTVRTDWTMKVTPFTSGGRAGSGLVIRYSVK